MMKAYATYGFFVIVGAQLVAAVLLRRLLVKSGKAEVLKERWHALSRFWKSIFIASCVAICYWALIVDVWLWLLLGFLIKGEPFFSFGATCAVCLLGIFAASATLSFAKRKVGLAVFVLALCASTSLFLYETTTHRWQRKVRTADGCKESYLNWPGFRGWHRWR